VREETFEIDTTHFGGVLHHQMQNHPAIYAVLRDALGPRPVVDYPVVDRPVVDHEE
jgi:hypothetical protein